MKIVEIDSNNIKLIDDFIVNLGSSSETFRYFNTRTVSVLQNHLATIALIGSDSEVPLAYGHLEPFNDKVWLGICVREGYLGKGFGKIILNELIKIAKVNNLRIITLSVDRDNVSAINLYKKYNFINKNMNNKNYLIYELAL